MADRDVEFGARLREAREAKGMAPDAAAARMRISYSTLMNHEAGYRGGRKRAPDYARIYGVNLTWLLDDAGPMKATDPLIAEISQLNRQEREQVENLLAGMRVRRRDG